jgi:hypothetical protein
VVIQLLLALAGLWFLLWPESARHLFVTADAFGIHPPRPVIVRLVGATLLLVLALLRVVDA